MPVRGCPVCAEHHTSGIPEAWQRYLTDALELAHADPEKPTTLHQRLK